MGYLYMYKVQVSEALCAEYFMLFGWMLRAGHILNHRKAVSEPNQKGRMHLEIQIWMDDLSK